MGPDVAPDLSEAELDSVMELKQKAQELEASGDHQGAVDVFTQVILKAPSPLVYAKRANAFVQMRKCLAAIRDCDKALEMNPDSAKAYKTRGIAHRYLGNWEQATMDLGKGLNIDYDEDAAAIQKICAEHYNKHRVHVAKKKAARELKEREEREERASKAKEEYERQKAESASAGAARRRRLPWRRHARHGRHGRHARHGRRRRCRTSLPSCFRRSCLIPSSCRRCRSRR